MQSEELEKRKLIWHSIKPETKPDWVENEDAEPPFADIRSENAIKLITENEIQIIDVRFDWEYKHYHIPDAVLIPLPELEHRFIEVDPDKTTLVVCEHGVRSVDACCYLNMMGMPVKNIFNLEGGMACYSGPVEKN